MINVTAEKKKTGLFSFNLRRYGMIFALMFIILLFGIATKGLIFRPMNISNLIMQNSYLIILTIGMFFCLLTGNVDLSVGSVAAFAGAISGHFIVRNNMPVGMAILITLIVGAIIGAFQGGFIAFLKVPPFIATLAGELIFRGLTLIILEGQSLAPFPKSFRYIASDFVFTNWKIGNINIFALVLAILASIALIKSEIIQRREKKKYQLAVAPLYNTIISLSMKIAVTLFIAYSLSSYKGIPFILVLTLFITLLYNFIAKETIFGRHVYAVGGNVRAAKLSGVKTHWIMFLVYVNSSILATIAGLVVTGRLNAAVPKAGVGFELDAIAACTIGSSSGESSIRGAIIGALVMAILNNGMSILGIGSDMQQVIKGFILLFAVAFDIYNKSKSSK